MVLWKEQQLIFKRNISTFHYHHIIRKVCIDSCKRVLEMEKLSFSVFFSGYVLIKLISLASLNKLQKGKFDNEKFSKPDLSTNDFCRHEILGNVPKLIP